MWTEQVEKENLQDSSLFYTFLETTPLDAQPLEPTANSVYVSYCYGTLWTLTFFFFFFFYLFFLILYFFSFEFLFLFSDDEEAHDIAVT